MDINNLNKIKLYCSDENQNYKEPEKMFDSYGNKLYAYVTLIMLGDKYIPAALVLAQSLIDLNSQADRVVLITPDVSYEGRELLSKFYNKVIEVNYVNIDNWRTKKQSYRKYLELVFTKFHLFNLTEYKKVLLIDADALILKHPDHLFSLSTPAGCFLENKELFIYYDEDGNYKMPPDSGIEWYNKYCNKLKHGNLIPKEFTDRVLYDFKNSGIGGGLILLEPKVGEFDEIIKDATSGRMKYLLENRFVWPEQQYLTARYSGKWTSINPRFFGLQGYPDWSVLFGLQYGGDKPFILESKFDINTRMSYRDFQLFHEFYRKILKEHPEFINSKVLNEVNNMNKYFKNQNLKRYENPHISSEQIAKIYRIDKKYISKDNLSNYHTNYNKFYKPHNIKPMFEEIKEFDYMQPIKKLCENNNSDYYKNLIKSYNVGNLNTRLDEYNKITPIDKDEIILQYIKCRPKTFIITLWNYINPISNEVIDFLKKNGNIYYVKKINLSFEELGNLMMHLYDDFTYEEIYNRMIKKLDWMKANKIDSNVITVIVFDNINNLKISGQGADFKMKIREFCIDKLKEKDLLIDDIRGNDLLHINDDFYQAIEYAQLYFNYNSLNLLKYMDTKTYFSNFFIPSHLKFNTLRKWCYSNMTLENLNRFGLMGSIDLYVHGIRNLGDIDGVYIANNDIPQEQELIELLNLSFSNKNTKINFIDVGIKNSKYWKDSWEEKNKKVLDYFNIKSFDDVIYNPKYHFVFHGIKIYLFDYELVRKIFRLNINNYNNQEYFLKQSAKDYTDIIMMYFYNRNLLGHYAYLDSNNKIKINDDFKIENFKLQDYDENKKNIFISTIKQNLFRYPKEKMVKITDNIITNLF